MHSRTVRSVWWVLWFCCALSACGELPLVKRKESHALPPAADTVLGKAAATQLRLRPAMTGAALLEDSVDAFGARVGLARAARRTLDVQYYIFHADNAGHPFLGELRAAAERGVRARLLLGGRNIGGEYFGTKPDLDFSDLDLLINGAVVAEVSAQFDQYWNSGQAYPVDALLRGGRPGADRMQALRADIARHVQAMQGAIDDVDPGDGKLAQQIAAGQLPQFFWGDTLVIADPPDKVAQPPRDSDNHAARKLVALREHASQELILVSPYFVPGRQVNATFLEAA